MRTAIGDTPPVTSDPAGTTNDHGAPDSYGGFDRFATIKPWPGREAEAMAWHPREATDLRLEATDSRPTKVSSG